MPVIKLSGFRGEQPRIIPRQLPDAGAQAAVNCRLDDGGLTPIQESVQFALAGGTDHQTIYKFGDTWLSWAGVVHAAPGPVDDTRLYYTGDGPPRMRKDADIYDLAITPPATAPTATLGGSGSGDVVSRTYCYTWVSGFGEESEPSPASAVIDWQSGNTVTLSAIESPPAGRNITKMRFYRSQTGQSGTGFYFIEERAAGNTDYSDTIAVDAFAEPLPSADWNAPPDELEGLVAMANGMMAAFKGRDVYFSEPYHPHAWPEKYVQTVDADIVGLLGLGTTLFILTTAYPHIAQGALPESMQLDRAKSNLPCLSARGISNMGFCGCYPSNEGLVRANPDGSIGYVSLPLYDRDKWQKLGPDTMIGSTHQGRFVGFYRKVQGDGSTRAGTITIDVGPEPFLWRASAIASAAFYDVETGALCYLPKGRADIWRFDDPTGSRAQQYWRSKPFFLPYPENFGAIQVDADLDVSAADQTNYQTLLEAIIAANQAMLDDGPVDGEINALAINAVPLGGDTLNPMPIAPGGLAVGVYANGKLVATIAVTNTAKRLPSGFKAEKWEIDVAGSVPITQIKMAKTIDELKRTA